MTDRPTPETDAEVTSYFEKKHPPIVCYHELAKFARRLERERDEARDTIVDVLSALKPMHNEGPRLAALRIKEERDKALDAVEKSKAFKRVMKEDNAKLRRELDELNKRLIEVCQYGVVCTIEREDLHKELDEARDDARVLLKEIFNIAQIGDPHPADLPMKALQAIAEMIDEHLKEARK